MGDSTIVSGSGASRRAVLASGLALTTAAQAPAALAQTGRTGRAQPTRQPDYNAVAAIDRRLCNLSVRGGQGVGVEMPNGILDVTATAERLGVPAPSDMDDLLQNGRGAELRAVIDQATQRSASAVLIPAEAARFAPLVTRPEKIICIGFNYRQHAEETNTPIPKAPPMFCKYNNTLTPHGGVVRLPTKLDYQFDYETELAIVIGRPCRDATEENALDHVAGYATGNDLSARQLQTITSQFTAGKSIDGFAPLGPWLGTRARVPDPHTLRITTRMNGELRQDWTTADMIFNCRKLIAYASAIMTLKPGDVILTGTPQGVILGQKIPAAERRWLRPGDVVVSELEGLGALQVTLA